MPARRYIVTVHEADQDTIQDLKNAITGDGCGRDCETVWFPDDSFKLEEYLWQSSSSDAPNVTKSTMPLKDIPQTATHSSPA